jgi:hypothetical protein
MPRLAALRVRARLFDVIAAHSMNRSCAQMSVTSLHNRAGAVPEQFQVSSAHALHEQMRTTRGIRLSIAGPHRTAHSCASKSHGERCSGSRAVPSLLPSAEAFPRASMRPSRSRRSIRSSVRSQFTDFARAACERTQPSLQCGAFAAEMLRGIRRSTFVSCADELRSAQDRCLAEPPVETRRIATGIDGRSALRRPMSSRQLATAA